VLSLYLLACRGGAPLRLSEEGDPNLFTKRDGCLDTAGHKSPRLPLIRQILVRRRIGRVKFVVSEVPHRKQRYETVGDWIPGKPVAVRVSRMKDERYVFLVALHELIEYELCRMKGITDERVVEFDKKFERERSMGLREKWEEPGDDARAPYRREHQFATMIERMVAQKLAVRWPDYEKTVTALSARPKFVAKQMVTSGN